ncbi:tRNA dihydrouridine(20/20a) synthase DusA [Ideonella livida]|uniref:tRNA-dihydrouridine(20/20a) synthase n=1 Tax=Ideonella livida TaxID=2707176 RepID=A0A7C9THL4_9BURK|nr:tRNA dihydrouridine(20/20a) synthase DusA [Ideonella livida]NDY90641.1 tRNA dihydrouridine(20/20a) synthase DusA [Ideonella livida]
MNPWRVSVAPMLDWTDRHCRYFHRLITRRTRLYTEMVTTGALLHGDVARHLDHSVQEQPLALQLGGSEPGDLAQSARLARQWGYDEVNLNCGCPSERVQRGAFGACLMREPRLVADCVRAMVEAATPSRSGERALPVTVKHRIGIDQEEGYGFVRDFVGTVAEAGCRVFIVHARNAWLKGLSPKENREIPPLRPEIVYRLKRDFPGLTVVINGGVRTAQEMHVHLAQLDGVMVGREAYHNPWWMADWDQRFWGETENPATDRAAVERAMVAYMSERRAQAGTAWPHVARHMLGLWNGQPGARRWRQVWSDASRKGDPAEQVWQAAQRPA